MVMTLKATIQQFKTIIKKNNNIQQCDVKFSFYVWLEKKTIFVLVLGYTHTVERPQLID